MVKFCSYMYGHSVENCMCSNTVAVIVDVGGGDTPDIFMLILKFEMSHQLGVVWCKNPFKISIKHLFLTTRPILIEVWIIQFSGCFVLGTHCLVLVQLVNSYCLAATYIIFPSIKCLKRAQWSNMFERRCFHIHAVEACR